MDATVTLKLTPQEFDLVREALAEFARASHIVGRDSDLAPEARRKANHKAAQLDELLRKVA